MNENSVMVTSRWYTHKSRAVKKVPASFSTSASYKSVMLDKDDVHGAVVDLVVYTDLEDSQKIRISMSAEESERLGNRLISMAASARKIAEEVKKG